ncbi:GNAT family N-acetyltransferase [Calidifontibacillus oryziterrae]|uniref:GNAT family N-acetyltransferase n=1 Tax=Calidifontibacillus oryziterrae TaxID=1191699 RepID=UPI00031DCCCE|nr:GNAT family N-acetyltransferase [Calidifontibacillus oryziterrae]
MKVIRKATSNDIAAIEQVVGQAGLQTNGITENIGNFLIMENGYDQLITAVVGFELHNNIGLLRSLVMSDQSDHVTVLQLIKAVLQYANNNGIKQLYLCTLHSSTIALFEMIGFKIEENTPIDIQLFDHFQMIQNEKPIIMKYTF